MPSHRALVVGLGQIGMGYDFDLPAPAHVMTHVRAFNLHPAFELVGGVDLSAERRLSFESRYAVAAFKDIGAAIAATEPDVVALATPTNTHKAALVEILSSGRPKLVLCEKPLSYSYPDAADMVALARQSGTTLLVNYMRRSDPAALEIRRRLLTGEMPGPVKAVVWYSKGMFNNGSHLLNLLEMWLGAVLGTEIIQHGRRWGGIDPEPDFLVRFASGSAVFLAAREEDFSHYTIELITPGGRLSYEQGGEDVAWWSVVADPKLPSYRVLTREAEALMSGLNRSQWHVVDQLANLLSGSPADLCSAEAALATLNTLTGISERL